MFRFTIWDLRITILINVVGEPLLYTNNVGWVE